MPAPGRGAGRRGGLGAGRRGPGAAGAGRVADAGRTGAGDGARWSGSWLHGLPLRARRRGAQRPPDDRGLATVEQALDIDLYDGAASTLTAVNLALHAHALLTRDVDYIVRDGKVQLINPSRGRVALLQRWPDGLQAAVEAKEALSPAETGEILRLDHRPGLSPRYPGCAG